MGKRQFNKKHSSTNKSVRTNNLDHPNISLNSSNGIKIKIYDSRKLHIGEDEDDTSTKTYSNKRKGFCEQHVTN